MHQLVRRFVSVEMVAVAVMAWLAGALALGVATDMQETLRLRLDAYPEFGSAVLPLVTAALPGDNAVTDRWTSQPAAAVTAIGEGLRALHEALLAADGRWSGHVDLGMLGVTDRWADLAVATWSAEWNYGPGWDGLLLDSYGVSPDPERIRYYRLLWDLSS